ncbi:MAG: apiosidase-like domain-containing protein, partial [Anaerolineae bacterium]
MPTNGPIRVSANGRYFVTASGEPWFWLGDTAWPLFVQYSVAEAEAYLADRAARGFTVIQGVLGWGNGSGMENPQPDANATGHRPWGASPAEPDPVFFEQVDYLLDTAERLGLVLAMLPTWGYYVTDSHTFDAENAFIYGRFLGERYQERPNVIWVSGGDRVPTGGEEAYRGLARGLHAGDGGAHLVTYHPCGWTSSSQYWYNEDWLGFNMIETWTDWDKVYPAILADYCASPAKPVVLGEGAYENGPEYPLGPITPLLIRRQAWWAFMAGGYYTNGQDRMWRMGEG